MNLMPLTDPTPARCDTMMPAVVTVPTVAERFPFVADWVDALFIHCPVEARVLNACLPAGLVPDLFEEDAYVSLVAFTQKNLRPSWGGRVGWWLSRPLSDHLFLNLRTYVRRGGEPGIFFLSEWINNALAAAIGPRLYGLPYRLGKLTYTTGLPFEGAVRTHEGQLLFTADAHEDHPYPAALDAFLLERYAAWTIRRSVLRRFRIRHHPWPFQHATAHVADASLLGAWNGVFAGSDRACLAHYSEGVRGVQISMPARELN